jgi:hypothetical protein
MHDQLCCMKIGFAKVHTGWLKIYSVSEGANGGRDVYNGWLAR